MGYLTKIKCKQCGNESNIMVGYRGNHSEICGDCEKLNNLNERNEYLDKLKTLPLEKRIERIEKWIYVFEKSKNMKIKFMDGDI